jgi:hypothetical protein
MSATSNVKMRLFTPPNVEVGVAVPSITSIASLSA